MPAGPDRRLQRFAWMLALVVVLRFAAWEIHHVFDTHLLDEHCEICAVVDRSGDAPAMVYAQSVAPAPVGPLLAPERIIPVAAFVSSALPRGPPRLEA